MKNDALVIYRDIAVKYRAKEYHARKMGGRSRRAFANFYGDIPVFYHNDVTGKWEEVVNPRGRAYAARRRQQYRPNRRNAQVSAYL